MSIKIKKPATIPHITDIIFGKTLGIQALYLYHTNCDGLLHYVEHQSEFWCDKCKSNIDAMRLDSDNIAKTFFYYEDSKEVIYKMCLHPKGYTYMREATPEETEHYFNSKEPADIMKLYKE